MIRSCIKKQKPFKKKSLPDPRESFFYYFRISLNESIKTIFYTTNIQQHL